MKLATIFQTIALVSAATPAAAKLGEQRQRRAKAGKNGVGGGGRGKGRGKGRGEGRGNNQTPKVPDAGTQNGGAGGSGGKVGGNPFDGGTVDTLIVTLTKDKDKDLTARCAEQAVTVGGTVQDVYDIGGGAMSGCALNIPSAGASALSMSIGTLSSSPSVMAVEEDQAVYKSQQYAWGLDRVDQCGLPLNQQKTKADADGARVYIVDTGLDREHAEFAGMVNTGTGSAYCHKDTTGNNAPFSDGDGHGTHVAGTACGKDYGVAKNCDLCAVRVLDDNGSGTWSGVVAGINHVAQDCAKVPGRKCVANLSLGGVFSAIVNQAVAAAVASGVVMVLAAGNESTDACTKSPASEQSGVTVGSTTISDGVSSFSNGGSCVDVYAPGSSIVSARAGGGSETLSGTSMASPHVAGIAAGLLALGVSPGAVSSRLKADAPVLGTHMGSTVLLANTVGCNGPTPPPTPCPHPVTRVAITTDTFASETSWTLENLCGGEGAAADDYNEGNVLDERDFCLPPARYRFTINDSYGDGMCCNYGNGGYVVTVGSAEMAEGDNFSFSEVTTYGSCAPVSTPPPTPNPTPNPTNPPTTPPTPNPTPNPTKMPTKTPTMPPTPNPTPNPTKPPTPSPIPAASIAPSYAGGSDTPGPTFFTCSQFNEAKNFACTNAYGGGKCQWLGSCHNCGCVIAKGVY